MLLFLILCLTDWGIFESRFNDPHNLKTIALEDAPVDTVLAVLSGRVEEVELNLRSMSVRHSDLCMMVYRRCDIIRLSLQFLSQHDNHLS